MSDLLERARELYSRTVGGESAKTIKDMMDEIARLQAVLDAAREFVATSNVRGIDHDVMAEMNAWYALRDAVSALDGEVKP